MTKISDIKSAVVTLVSSTITGYQQLSNPYAIDENSHLTLKQGFGVAVGPGRDTERYVGCLVTWERLFTIILIRQVLTTQNNVTAREVIDTALLDDHDKLRKAFYLDSTLSGKAIVSTVSDDGGVFYAGDQEEKFLGLELTLKIEYQEDPNT